MFQRTVEDDMKCSIIALCILVASFYGCKKDSQSPTGPGGETNFIENASFEINGAPSYQGWQFWSNVQTSPAFSDDVPPAGGSCSIVLSVGDRVIAYLQKNLATPTGSNRYKFSLWAKFKGDPGYAALIFNKSIRKTILIQDSVWRYYEVTDSLETVQGDSLTILLNPGTSSRTAQSYFDLCRLETIK
jgi:hypothetical protein